MCIRDRERTVIAAPQIDDVVNVFRVDRGSELNSNQLVMMRLRIGNNGSLPIWRDDFRHGCSLLGRHSLSFPRDAREIRGANGDEILSEPTPALTAQIKRASEGGARLQ